MLQNSELRVCLQTCTVCHRPRRHPAAPLQSCLGKVDRARLAVSPCTRPRKQKTGASGTSVSKLTRRLTTQGHLAKGSLLHLGLPGRDAAPARPVALRRSGTRLGAGGGVGRGCSSRLCRQTPAPGFLQASLEGPALARGERAWAPTPRGGSARGLAPGEAGPWFGRQTVRDWGGLGAGRVRRPLWVGRRGYGQAVRTGPCLQGTVWERWSGLCAVDLESIGEICISQVRPRLFTSIHLLQKAPAYLLASLPSGWIGCLIKSVKSCLLT